MERPKILQYKIQNSKLITLEVLKIEESFKQVPKAITHSMGKRVHFSHLLMITSKDFW